MQTIPYLLICAVNACQNFCEHCAHKGMMDSDRDYQMTLEDIAALINRLKAIDCKIKTVSIDGPGEPLLWRHFNAAIRLMAASDRIGRIESVTNGHALNVIADDVWDKLACLDVSRYEYTIDESILSKHPGKYRLIPRGDFLRLDESKLPFAKKRCDDLPYAMYYKGRIYPQCFPPLFDACRRAGMNPETYGVPLERWVPVAAIPDPPCEYCWASKEAARVSVKHRMVKRIEPKMTVMGMDVSLKIGCVNSCAYCPQALLKNYKGERVFTLESFTRCMSRGLVPASRHLSFAGYSEPFGCPDCAAIITRAHRVGHTVSLYTTLRGATHKDIDALAQVPMADVILHLPADDNRMGFIVDHEYAELVRHAYQAWGHNENTRIACESGPLHPWLLTGGDKWFLGIYKAHDRAGELPGLPHTRHTGPLPYCGKRECGHLLPNGDVVCCTNDYELKRVWGNLFRNTYADIFKGLPYLAYMARVKEQDVEIPCRHCQDDFCRYVKPDTRIEVKP